MLFFWKNMIYLLSQTSKISYTQQYVNTYSMKNCYLGYLNLNLYWNIKVINLNEYSFLNNKKINVPNNEIIFSNLLR